MWPCPQLEAGLVYQLNSRGWGSRGEVGTGATLRGPPATAREKRLPAGPEGTAASVTSALADDGHPLGVTCLFAQTQGLLYFGVQCPLG